MKNKAEIETRIPMNLQFFADGAEGTEADVAENNNPESDNSPTVEQLMAELAKERAESAKNKSALDKALKETGDLKKSLRAKQSADELAEESRKEQEEAQKAYVKDLEDYKAHNEAVKRYLMQGMDAETASNAATAEIDGDMDALSDIQKSFREASIKAEKAKWLAERPPINAGTGYTTMTKEQILAITDPAKQREAIAQNLSLFSN